MTNSLLRAHILIMSQALIYFGGYDMCLRIIVVTAMWVMIERWLIYRELNKYYKENKDEQRRKDL